MTDNSNKQLGVYVAGSISQMMRAAAAAAGCTIDIFEPGAPGPNDLLMPARTRQYLMPVLRLGEVEHTYTPKPLTKRQKRRLRGKQKER
jgi:hypothetical protein